MGVTASRWQDILCKNRVSPGAANRIAKKNEKPRSKHLQDDPMKPVNIANKRRVSEEDLPATFENLGYSLGPILGSGNFGCVRELVNHNEHPPSTFAVKILNCSRAPRDLVKHFLPREMEALRWVQHPNIVPVYQVFYLGRHLCLVMELMKFNLGEVLVEQGALSSHTARKVFSDVCAGLHYCHIHKLAHRDVKCQNILLDYEGTAK